LSVFDYLKEEKKLNEIIGIVACFAAIILFLSIISFSPDDYTTKTQNEDYVYDNFIGALGAEIDYAIFYIFGRSSYLIPFIFLIWGVYEFREKKVKEHLIVKLTAVFLIITAFCAIFEIFQFANPQEIPRELVSGGIIGKLFLMMKYYIGIGVYFLIVFFIIVAVILLTTLSFNQFFLYFWKWTETIVKNLCELLKNAAVKLLNLMKSGFIKCMEGFGLKWKNMMDSVKESVEQKRIESERKKVENLKIKIQNQNAKNKQNQLFSDKPKPGVQTIQGSVIPKDEIKSNETNGKISEPQIEVSNKPQVKSVEQVLADEIQERENMIKKISVPQNEETQNSISEESNSESEKDGSPQNAEENGSAEKIDDSDNKSDGNKETPEEQQTEEIESDIEEDPYVEQKITTANTNEIEVEEAIQKKPVVIKDAPPYELPPIELLNRPAVSTYSVPEEEIRDVVKKLEETFESFKIDAKVIDYNIGPTVTMYQVSPGAGVAVNKIANRQDDIKLQLAAKSIRIVAPIPGKSAVGIELPNKKPAMVTLRELIEAEEFEKSDAPLKMAIGKDILGKTIVANLAKMPHLLVAGATGSGKSVCVNTIIISLLMKMSPDDLKLILIDPKMVEFKVYQNLPHLMAPVVTDMKKAARALQWALKEMTDRYTKLSAVGARDIIRYNSMGNEKLPYLVIIVDELADLMALARKECEAAISRLAAMARAVGIHVILATQRPSVDVVTGLIKANFPSRIAFQVSSSFDARTILDQNGAEYLLGNGDMLYKPQSLPRPVRVQGAYVSDEEIERMLDFITSQRAFDPSEDMFSVPIEGEENEENENGESGPSDDEMIAEAERLVVLSRQGSVALLQRKLKVGHNRAVKLMNMLEKKGVVGPSLGPQPRQILIEKDAYIKMKGFDPESEQAKVF